MNHIEPIGGNIGGILGLYLAAGLELLKQLEMFSSCGICCGFREAPNESPQLWPDAAILNLCEMCL